MRRDGEIPADVDVDGAAVAAPGEEERGARGGALMICGGGTVVERVGGKGCIAGNSDHRALEPRIGERRGRSHAQVVGLRIAVQPADLDAAAPTGGDVDHGVAARIAGAAVAGQGFGIEQTGGDIAGAGIEPDGGKGVGIPQRVDAGDRDGVGGDIAGDRHGFLPRESDGLGRSPADAIAAGIGVQIEIVQREAEATRGRENGVRLRPGAIALVQRHGVDGDVVQLEGIDPGEVGIALGVDEPAAQIGPMGEEGDVALHLDIGDVGKVEPADRQGAIAGEIVRLGGERHIAADLHDARIEGKGGNGIGLAAAGIDGAGLVGKRPDGNRAGRLRYCRAQGPRPRRRRGHWPRPRG